MFMTGMGHGPGGGGGPGSGRGFYRHHRGGDEDELPPPSMTITNRRMLAWFYVNLAPHWPKVLFGVFAMIAGTSAGLYIPLILKDIFNKVIFAKDLAPLGGLAATFLGFTVLSHALAAARSLVMHLLGQRFVYQLRVQCYRHLMKLGLNYFERQRTGDVMSRVSNDVGAVEDMVVHGSDEIISNLLRVVGTVAIMFWLNYRLALVALAPLPLFIAGLWVFARLIRPIFSRIRIQLGAINTQLQERLSGIRVIKAFSREEAESEDFEESSRKYWRLSVKSIWMFSTFFPALGLLTSIGMVGMVWFGARLAALGGELGTPGDVVAFVAYLQQFYAPIGSLARVQNMLNQALASVARIFELLDERPAVSDKPDAIELGAIEGRVDLEHVSFRYDTGEMVLHDVSVSAEPGETVAIVGRSGAGKTSLVNLIPRFYDPCEGVVRVDGHDVREVSQASLRRNIGMVLQETYLFNDTVKENIRYARPEATDKEIVEAAQAAYASEFIERLPDGYDTVIGERGVRLSGGQKQRIAIARALLVDPRLLILDEATSLVDTEAEQIIQKALMDLMQGRTCFIIAHRLSTVRNADKIVVVDDGQIVEQDRHEALMARRGRYAEMYNRQFQLEESWGDAAQGLGGGLF